MTDVSNDAELKAIATLLSVLEPLDAEARRRVVDYAFLRLGLSATATAPHPVPSAPATTPLRPTSRAITDIRSLGEQKAPSTDAERVAVVAYYLAELVPQGQRQETIRAGDLKKYFKQANFPIPARADQTLVNAKNAGYFDSGPSRGTYVLNPVGHNLVAHGLPTAADAPKRAKPARKRSKPKKKPSKRKPARKKTRRSESGS